MQSELCTIQPTGFLFNWTAFDCEKKNGNERKNDSVNRKKNIKNGKLKKRKKK